MQRNISDIFKWCCITRNDLPQRYEFLSGFMESLSIPNRFSYLKPVLEDFPDVFEDAKTKYGQILIGEPFGETILKNTIRIPGNLLNLGSADWLQGSKDTWWPRNILNEAFPKVLAARGHTLDLEGTALIAGSSGTARSIIGSLLSMGISQFNITDQHDEKGMKLVEELKRYNFDADFNFLPCVDIINLSGSHSIIVNTTPLVPENIVLPDLYYFNFLKPDGIVVDLTLLPTEPPLTREAKAVGATILYGHEVAAHVDILWIKKVFDKEIPVKDYDRGLKDCLSKIDFDMTPFQRD